MDAAECDCAASAERVESDVADVNALMVRARGEMPMLGRAERSHSRSASSPVPLENSH